MVDIYIFNPENDLALAHGGDNYTAPPYARHYRRGHQLLPAWLAPSGSAVLVEADSNLEACNAWLNEQCLNVQPVTPDMLPGLSPCRFHPWGWSRALRKDLLLLGAREQDLPTLDWLDQLRMLSHRRTAIVLHQRLSNLLGETFSPLPRELHSLDKVLDFVVTASGGSAPSHDLSAPLAYLKSPWSNSGHGIYRVLDVSERHMHRWVSGVLKHQGSVMGETALSPVQDFALEWQCEHGEMTLTGYSVFYNDDHDQFHHGLLGSNDELHALLVARYPRLDTVADAMRQVLQEVIAPHYEGLLGVDMLLYDDNGAIRLDPCVELNLRTTMGHVNIARAARAK